jgi:hypothetical protein
MPVLLGAMLAHCGFGRDRPVTKWSPFGKKAGGLDSAKLFLTSA